MTINKDKLYRVADWIEDEPHVNYNNCDNPRDELHGFNMNMVRHSCGTPACIAGYMVTQAVKDGHITEEALKTSSVSTYVQAAAWFHDQSVEDYRGSYFFDLFEPRSSVISKDWDDITPSEAARVIRHLADTGEVDWSIIVPTAE